MSKGSNGTEAAPTPEVVANQGKEVIKFSELMALVEKDFKDVIVIGKEDLDALMGLIGEATFPGPFQKPYNIVSAVSKRTAVVSNWLSTIVAQPKP